MKKLALLLTTVVGLLSGCVAYEVPSHDRDYRGDRNYHDQHRGDRDRDGVPNSQDRRPDDPRRY
jgi:hypothetical protein